MTKKELAELVTQNQSNQPDWFDRVDKELLKVVCEQMSDEEWEKLSDCTIEFLGKQLLDKKDKKNLHFDVGNFLSNRENSG